MHQTEPDYILPEPLTRELNLTLSPGDLAREEEHGSFDFTDHSSLLDDMRLFLLTFHFAECKTWCKQCVMGKKR